MSRLRGMGHHLRPIGRLTVGPHRAMVFNAGTLVIATGLNSVLGVAYWWLAARLLPPAAVGLASTAISAMTLLGTIGVLGLGTLLLGELPRHRGAEGPLILTTLLAAGGTSALLGLLILPLAPLLAAELGSLASSPAAVGLFALGTGLTAVTLVLDQALIGLLRGGLQLWRNAVFSLTKLVLLVAVGLWLGDASGLGLFATWVIGSVASLTTLIGQRVIAVDSPRRWSLRWQWLRSLGWQALRHHALNVALLLASLTLPLVVAAMVSVEMAAYYYTGAMVASLVVILPSALTTVLYRLAASDPASLSRWLRLVLGLVIVAGLMINLGLAVAARPMLSLFGPSYVEHAEWPLRLLSLNIFPVAVRECYATINRVRGRPSAALGLVLLGGLLTITGGAIGAWLGGLVGLCIGVVLAMGVEALVMLPAVYRVARGEVCGSTVAPPGLGEVTSRPAGGPTAPSKPGRAGQSW